MTDIDITYDAGGSSESHTLTWDEVGRLETAAVGNVTITWLYDYAGVPVVVTRDDGVNVATDEFEHHFHRNHRSPGTHRWWVWTHVTGGGDVFVTGAGPRLRTPGCGFLPVQAEAAFSCCV